MDDRDDLLHRIQMLEQQLATVIERTGLAEPARPSPTGRSHHATEHKKARRSGGRKRSPGRQQQAPEERAPVPSRPARIPGVRIACIGARPEALDGIRSYWEGRSATFLSYDTVGTTLRTLDRDLGRADVIFFCVDRIDTESYTRLEVYCNQTEKALVPLRDAEMSGLGAALEGLCPLA